MPSYFKISCYLKSNNANWRIALWERGQGFWACNLFPHVFGIGRGLLVLGTAYGLPVYRVQSLTSLRATWRIHLFNACITLDYAFAHVSSCSVHSTSLHTREITHAVTSSINPKVALNGTVSLVGINSMAGSTQAHTLRLCSLHDRTAYLSHFTAQ